MKMRKMIVSICAGMMLACGSKTPPPPKDAPKPLANNPLAPVTTKNTPVTTAPNTKPASTPASTSAPASQGGVPTPTAAALTLSDEVTKGTTTQLVDGTGALWKYPEPGEGNEDHTEKWGWSKDGTEFMYCTINGATEGQNCTFQKAGGAGETLNDYKDGPDGETVIDKKKAKALDKKIKDGGYAASMGNWSYAANYVILWDAIIPEEDEAPRIFKLGSLSRDGKKKFLPIEMVAPGMPGMHDVHPDAVAVSPDGKSVAVLVHTFGGEYSDTFALAIYPTDSLVAK